MSSVHPAGLYPIIRRLRRPLVIEDDDAAAAPAPSPSPSPSPGEDVNYAKAMKPSPEAKDAKRANRARG